MDPNQAPTLEHGIPDPETYLPGTPDGYWWFLIGGMILTILAILWLLKLLFQRPQPEKALEGRDLFSPAMKSLTSLEAQTQTKLVSEVAAEASLAIRTYLAGSRSEPALYETVEEFQARQSVLPGDANSHLNELNNAKYSKSEVNPDRSLDLIKKSQECLEKLRLFAPADSQTSKPSPPPISQTSEAGWFRNTIIKRSLAGVPLGIILALIGLLGAAYQRRDLAPQLEGGPLVWIGLGVSLFALIVHLSVRPHRSRS